MFEFIIAYESVGSYGCDSVSFFLLKGISDGKYYEVHGSHCSCDGFEGQFELESCTLEYLNREVRGYFLGPYDESGGQNLTEILNKIKELT